MTKRFPPDETQAVVRYLAALRKMKLSSYRCLRCEDRKWVCAEHEFEPWQEEEGGCVICGGPAARLACPSCSAIEVPDLPSSLMQYRAPVGPLDWEPTNDVVWKWRIRWAGRWQRTRMHHTEAEIRREHPEAERLDETKSLRPIYRLPE